MQAETIRSEFISIVERNRKKTFPEGTLTNDSFLGGDLGMDSIEILEALVDLQKQLAVSIPKEELGELYTLGDVIGLVQRFGSGS